MGRRESDGLVWREKERRLRSVYRITCEQHLNGEHPSKCVYICQRCGAMIFSDKDNEIGYSWDVYMYRYMHM